MPFINVKTNISVSKDKQEAVKSAIGRAIAAIPGKSEAWLMVEIEQEKSMWFKGDSSPCAMVEVSVFGSASGEACEKLTAELCEILNKELSLSPSRIYVKYFETQKWGWSGGNF